MEMEIDNLCIPEISQTSAAWNHLISPWLELDENYAAAFPDQIQASAHFLDNFDHKSGQAYIETDDTFSISADLKEFYTTDHPSGVQLQLPHQQQQPQASVAGESAPRLASALGEDGSGSSLLDSLDAPEVSCEFFFEQCLALASVPPEVAPAPTKSSCLIPTRSSSPTSGGVDGGRAEEDTEEEQAETEEDTKSTPWNSKNLVSERNRRKRLTRQLLALRSLVPTITKMDKRSILVDALAYLKNIHEETTTIEIELKQRSSSSPPSCKNSSESISPSTALTAPETGKHSKPRLQIQEIDVEKIEAQRFVVKISSKGGVGAGAEVLRVIESLGYEITFAALDQMNPKQLLTTIFLRVKRHGRMTEEKMRDSIKSKALRSGLRLLNP